MWQMPVEDFLYYSVGFCFICLGWGGDNTQKLKYKMLGGINPSFILYVSYIIVFIGDLKTSLGLILCEYTFCCYYYCMEVLYKRNKSIRMFLCRHILDMSRSFL